MTSITKVSGLLITVFLLVSLVSADYYYTDDQFSSDDWGAIPEFESHEEIVAQFVAPFLFITILLQFALTRALEFTFDTGHAWEEGPDVKKEATIMAVTIALMVVVSPYWELIQQMAASIGVLAVGALILVFLFMIYVFVRPQ